MCRASKAPLAYGLDTEVAGVDRVAAEAGFERFHLVGFSAGGASSLAYALARPGRLRSLTLAEPAWAGIEGRTPEEAAAFGRFAFPTTDVQAFERPVLFVLGGLSNPAYYRAHGRASRNVVPGLPPRGVRRTARLRSTPPGRTRAVRAAARGPLAPGGGPVTVNE